MRKDWARLLRQLVRGLWLALLLMGPAGAQMSLFERALEEGAPWPPSAWPMVYPMGLGAAWRAPSLVSP